MAKLQWLVAVSAILLIAGNAANAYPAPGLLESVIAAPQYSTLVTALKVTNLVPAVAELLKTTPLTVFAPTNAAFAKVDKQVFTFLTTTPEGKKILADILLYHVVKGKFPAPRPGQKLWNLAGGYLYISKWFYKLYVNKVKIIAPGVINVPQGVVHGIESVIIPPKYAHIFKPKKKYGYFPWW